jgi:hypothetical protein
VLPVKAWRLLWGAVMRPRTMLSDVRQEAPKKPVRRDATLNTYERVRETLDEAIAELQLPPTLSGDDTARIKLMPVSR